MGRQETPIAALTYRGAARLDATFGTQHHRAHENFGAELHPQTYHLGDYIIRPGDSLDAVFVILAGNVRQYRQAKSGHALRFAELLCPGQLLGLDALGSVIATQTGSVALTEPTVVAAIPRRRFLDRLFGGCWEAEGTFLDVCRQLEEARDLAEELACCNIVERLGHLLARLVSISWSNLVTDTHEALASMIGAHPNRVTKALPELEAMNLIRYERHEHRIEVLDAEGLAAL